jgi:hypothetical protein
LGAHKCVVNYSYVTNLTSQPLLFYFIARKMSSSESDNFDCFRAITHVPVIQIKKPYSYRIP